LRIVAGILLAVLLVGVLIIAGLGLAVEWTAPTYRGNGTLPHPR
jgi:hypothetical protein